MNPRYRSFSGALIAVFAVPVLLGLTACLPAVFPVPVGNPEKSRIDPDVSGIWVDEDEESFWLFQPYDKRTWILGTLYISEQDCEERELAEADLDADDVVSEFGFYDSLMLDLERYQSDCFESEHLPGVIKAWRTKLGGEWFMTWEILGNFNAETEFESQEWIVFRIDKSDPGQLRLQWISSDHPAWDVYDGADEEDVKQRDVERIIRKNAKDESFYDEGEEFLLQRLQPNHYELIEDFLDGDL